MEGRDKEIERGRVREREALEREREGQACGSEGKRRRIFIVFPSRFSYSYWT